eukprot:gene15114-32063_t
MSRFVSNDPGISTTSVEPTSIPTNDSLAGLYTSVERSFKATLDGNLSDSGISDAIGKIQKAIKELDNQSLISSNEELEDIPTTSVKYLFLHYFLGKVLTNSNAKDPIMRKSSLENAKKELQIYLQICRNLYIIRDEDDIDNEEQVMSAEERRHKKIEAYKRERDMQQRIQLLESRIAIQNGENDITSQDIDNEEEMRNLYLLKLQAYIYDTRKELKLIDE